MKRRTLKGIVALGVAACVAPLAWNPRPLLVWNVTPSAPIGLYRHSGDAIVKGAWVLVRPPKSAARLAAMRGYLPANIPMVKRVAAMTGDLVCRDGEQIRINGQPAARALKADSQGRDLPTWQGCDRLSAGELFLLTAPTASFDSRYFGAVPARNLIERIQPIWTYSAP